MNSEEVESCVRNNIPWEKLNASIKQKVGNTAKEYDKCILHFSLKNQIRYKNNLVQRLRKGKFYNLSINFKSIIYDSSFR